MREDHQKLVRSSDVFLNLAPREIDLLIEETKKIISPKKKSISPPAKKPTLFDKLLQEKKAAGEKKISTSELSNPLLSFIYP
jgi:hypothetical protein